MRVLLRQMHGWCGLGVMGSMPREALGVVSMIYAGGVYAMQGRLWVWFRHAGAEGGLDMQVHM